MSPNLPILASFSLPFFEIQKRAELAVVVLPLLLDVPWLALSAASVVS
jgi:hypothetical protein